MIEWTQDKPDLRRRARSLLSAVRNLVESGWTQKGYCVDASDETVRSERWDEEACKSPKAVAWCLHGALRAKWDNDLMGERTWYAAMDAMEHVCPPLIGERGAAPIETFNDRWARDVGDVLDLIDRAIRVLR